MWEKGEIVRAGAAIVVTMVDWVLIRLTLPALDYYHPRISRVFSSAAGSSLPVCANPRCSSTARWQMLATSTVSAKSRRRRLQTTGASRQQTRSKQSVYLSTHRVCASPQTTRVGVNSRNSRPRICRRRTYRAPSSSATHTGKDVLQSRSLVADVVTIADGRSLKIGINRLFIRRLIGGHRANA